VGGFGGRIQAATESGADWAWRIHPNFRGKEEATTTVIEEDSDSWEALREICASNFEEERGPEEFC
jgi:hypothetical protein